MAVRMNPDMPTVIAPAKRLGMELVDQWYADTPMMERDDPKKLEEVWDWWHGFSPRNGRGASVEGTWAEWVQLAHEILAIEEQGGPYLPVEEE